MRQDCKFFAQKCNQKLEEKSRLYGSYRYRISGNLSLAKALSEEVKLLEKAIENTDHENINRHSINISNYSMMINVNSSNVIIRNEFTGLSFSEAIQKIKEGSLLSRRGWNGADMYIFLVPGSTFKVNRDPLIKIYPEGKEVNYHPHIDMRTSTGEIVPWSASQTDMLANDWMIIEVQDG